MTMYACIYFEEDKSLSVVNKNDKDLTVCSEFKARNSVEMTWRKPGKKSEIFHGTIVKVGENEETLNSFATKAYNALIKSSIGDNVTGMPEELFSFTIKSAYKPGSKRERVVTERARESVAQNLELSPKKKSKMQAKSLDSVTPDETSNLTSLPDTPSSSPKTVSVDVSSAKKTEKTTKVSSRKLVAKSVPAKTINQDTPARLSAEIRKGQESANVTTSRKMLDMFDQFIDHVDDTVKPNEQCTPDTSVPVCESSSSLKPPPGSSPRKLLQVDSNSAVKSQLPATSSLTDTLPVCESSSLKPPPGSSPRILQVDSNSQVKSQLPATSSLTDTLPGVCESSSYLKPPPGSSPRILQVDSNSVVKSQLPATSSLTDTWNMCKEAMQTLHGTGEQIPVVTPEIIQTLRMISNPDFVGFIKSFLDHIENGVCAHPCFQAPVSSAWSTGNNSYVADLTDSSFQQGDIMDISNHGNQAEMAATEPATSTPTKERHPRSNNSTLVSPIRRSPRKQETNKSKENPHKMASPKRRSPRKQKNVQDPEEMVRLLESSDLMIDRTVKRKALRAAQTKLGKEGYVLMYKLTGEVFTIQELANCRGIGLGKVKPGDTRPSLDKSKIADLKEFVVAWCKAHVKLEHRPTEAGLNDAVTERIGYARKQNKKLLY